MTLYAYAVGYLLVGLCVARALDRYAITQDGHGAIDSSEYAIVGLCVLLWPIVGVCTGLALLGRLAVGSKR